MDISFDYNAYFLIKEFKSDSEHKKTFFGFLVISIITGIFQFFI